MNEQFSIVGKVAVVTGGSGVLGSNIAEGFLRAGARVIIIGAHQERVDAALERLRAVSSEVAGTVCNVLDIRSLQAVKDQVLSQWGRIDILVNNAGITRDGLIMKMSEEDFDRVLDTNLKGAFHTIRHASRYFLKQKSGKIINISSVSGVMGNAGQANYSASKAGVIGLTKSVARELASRGITCNAVAPGFIETEMTEAMPELSLIHI